jgi:bifunctional non-homologous end joining protein LigD
MAAPQADGALPVDRALPAPLRRRLLDAGAARRWLRAAEVTPMLAGIAEPFSRAGWIFELKYDGFRLIAGKTDGTASLRFRRGAPATDRFPEVTAAVGALRGTDLVLDGELVALAGDGRPDFQRLQKRFVIRRAADVAAAARALPCRLFAFDLLAADGLDLRAVPLVVRKEALRAVVEGSAVGYVEHVEEDGRAFYAEVRGRGLEGLMAKRAQSRYAPGRTVDWLKFPVQRTRDFVVVGFTAPGLGRDGGLHLAAAAAGGRELVYAGRVGSGFEAGILGTVREVLGARAVSTPPCARAPRGRGHTWVEPRVVCEVRFLEQTDDGLLRHPVFVRFRPDKAPHDCYVGEKEPTP